MSFLEQRAGASLGCGTQAFCCGGFSRYGAWALGHTGFSSCSLWAVEHGLSSCSARACLLHSMWNLPGPGIKLVFPALAGRLLSVVPPGKPRALAIYCVVESQLSSENSPSFLFPVFSSLGWKSNVWRKCQLFLYWFWGTTDFSLREHRCLGWTSLRDMRRAEPILQANHRTALKMDFISLLSSASSLSSDRGLFFSQ